MNTEKLSKQVDSALHRFIPDMVGMFVIAEEHDVTDEYINLRIMVGPLTAPPEFPPLHSVEEKIELSDKIFQDLSDEQLLARVTSALMYLTTSMLMGLLNHAMEKAIESMKDEE